MTLNGWLQIVFFLLAIFLVAPPLGSFMSKVFARERTWLDPVLRPIERLVYRATGVDETHEMRWTEYAVALLLFSVVSMLVLYLMERDAAAAAVQSAGIRRRWRPTSPSTRPRRSRPTRTGRRTAANRP